MEPALAVQVTVVHEGAGPGHRRGTWINWLDWMGDGKQVVVTPVTVDALALEPQAASHSTLPTTSKSLNLRIQLVSLTDVAGLLHLAVSTAECKPGHESFADVRFAGPPSQASRLRWAHDRAAPVALRPASPARSTGPATAASQAETALPKRRRRPHQRERHIRARWCRSGEAISCIT